MIYHVWMIPQLWTLITNNFFFQSLTAASCHSARRACPKLQNPLFQKAKENLLPGEKAPVRADEGVAKKESSPNLTQRLRRSPLFQRTKVIPGIMDSATSPFGSAQNDSIGGDFWESNENKGRFQSCTWGSDTNNPALPFCAPLAYKGFG